ncbi:TonB-dependent receptor [Chitinimonas sp.]|uniref:TonB-dependent receptor n=1 Tax=Chitinimonas sp. TaxID=1934313 RepID=UPI002F931728
MKMKQLAYAISLMGIAGMVQVHADDAPAKVEKIEVTGTSIKRIAKEGALPVTTITRDEIQRSGATSTEQLVSTIAAANTGGAVSTSSAFSVSSFGQASASLRGLGDTRTLVLVNGRRLANFATNGATVDINSIPMAAIERVEVLKDGASAVYGSDAVAGVINFILRKDYQGFEATGYYGAATQGGGEISRGSFVAGFGNLGEDKFNILITGDIEHQSQLMGKDRDFAHPGYNSLGDTTSGNTTPGNILGYYDSNNVFQSLGGNPTYPNCGGTSVNDPNFSNKCRFDPTPYVGLLPKVDRGDLVAKFNWDIAENVQLYGESMYSRNEHTFTEQPVPISSAFTYGVTGDSVAEILVRPTSPYYPTAWATQNGVNGQPLSVTYRAFDSGLRVFKDTAEQTRFLLGAKGNLGSWDYDVAASHNESKVKEVLQNGYPTYSKILPILNSDQFNPFATGLQSDAVSQAIHDANFVGTAISAKSSTDDFDARVSGELFDLPAGALAGAFGIQARKEKLDTTPSDALASGDISGYGGAIPAINKSRTANALFAEFNIPLLTGLEADLAIRRDHYSDFGNTTNPKVSFRWAPTKQLVLRASYGEGFRAPSLSDLYTPQTAQITGVISDPARCPTTNNAQDCSTQFQTLSGGNPNLKPEKSKQNSFGFVFEPTAGFSVGVDFFNVKLTDAITGGIDALTILNNPSYSYLVVRKPADAAYPNLPGQIDHFLQTSVNAAKIDVSGFDLDLKARIGKFDFGTISTALNGTYMSKYDYTAADGTKTGSVATYLTPALGANSQSGVIPRWKHVWSVNLDSGAWHGTLVQNFQTKYQDNVDADGNPHEVSSLTTYDLQGSYTGFKGLKLTLGVKNLFDRDPPAIVPNPNYFQAVYDPTYYDPRGRFVYGSVNYSFK